MNSFKFKGIFIALMMVPLIGVIAAPAVVVTSKTTVKANSSEVIGDTKKETHNSDSLSSDKVILNFDNADIQAVIKAISKLSGKNFVIDPRVKGTVNIISDQPISKVDSYKVLESALRMQGFATVEADGVIKVLPEAEVKSYGMKITDNVRNDLKASLGDQMITKVFVIKRGSAMQLQNALRPLVGTNSSLSVYTTSNALVVTDYASNITRISKIIDQLSTDAASIQQTPVVIPLKHAIAADMAQTLQAYMQGGSGASGGGGYSNEGAMVTVTVDPITNSLILSSVVKDKLDEIKALAISLDRNVGDTNGNMHVVYMKNADAVHVAEVLRVVASSQENADLMASSSLAKFTTEPTSTLQQGNGNGSGGLTATTNVQKNASVSKSTGQQGQKDQPRVIIQAEPTTNSVIIIAPESIYRNLRMVIQLLDIRRAQIMIEAMIADMNTNIAGTFGIQWVFGAGNNSIGGAAVSNYGGANNGANNNLAAIGGSIAAITSGKADTALQGLSAIPKEFFIGVFTGTVTVGGQTIPGLAALADMIASSNAANIISRPTIMTLDNEEARIMVGQNIGVINGSFVNSANSVAGNQSTFTRQDVGNILQIKPLIAQNGTIQLEVWQEISAVSPGTLNAPSGPVINKRNIRSSLLVDDGQIIALGGLTEDNVSITKNGIPLLQDIPYLGWLFSWQQRTSVKTNLVLFLRPVIVRDAKGSAALANPRYRYMNEIENMVKAKGNVMLPRIDPVTLDNQLPFKDQISTQPNNLVTDLPVVDMRMQSHPELFNKTVNTNQSMIKDTNVNVGNSTIKLPSSEK